MAKKRKYTRAGQEDPPVNDRTASEPPPDASEWDGLPAATKKSSVAERMRMVTLGNRKIAVPADSDAGEETGTASAPMASRHKGVIRGYPPKEQEVLDIAEVCRLLRVGEKFVRHLIKHEGLPATILGGAFKFDREQVLDWFRLRVEVTTAERMGYIPTEMPEDVLE